MNSLEDIVCLQIIIYKKFTMIYISVITVIIDAIMLFSYNEKIKH